MFYGNICRAPCFVVKRIFLQLMQSKNIWALVKMRQKRVMNPQNRFIFPREDEESTSDTSSDGGDSSCSDLSTSFDFENNGYIDELA